MYNPTEKFDTLLPNKSPKRLLKSKSLQGLGATSGGWAPFPQNTERNIERKILLQAPGTLTPAGGGGGPVGPTIFTAITLPSPTGSQQFPGGTTTQFGFQFITSAQITVTTIGRWRVAGSTDTVTLAIYDSSGTVLLGIVSLNLSTSTSEAFTYVSLVTPLVLAAGTYNCFSTYANDGAAGAFYSGTGNNGVPITSFASPITTVTGSHVTGAGYGTTAGNAILGPMNFQFHL